MTVSIRGSHWPVTESGYPKPSCACKGRHREATGKTAHGVKGLNNFQNTISHNHGPYFPSLGYFSMRQVWRARAVAGVVVCEDGGCSRELHDLPGAWIPRRAVSLDKGGQRNPTFHLLIENGHEPFGIGPQD